MKTNWSQ